MPRGFSIVFSPELVVGLLTLAVFGFCAQHGSYSTRDVARLERLAWVLPLIAVSAVFATVLIPAHWNWLWLVRANLALFAGLSASAFRIVGGFGAPGSGPKGQDAGFILILALGVILASFASSISAAWIQAAHQPAFAAWFREHRFLGTILVVLAAIPMGVGLVMVVGVTLGAATAFWSAFRR